MLLSNGQKSSCHRQEDESQFQVLYSIGKGKFGSVSVARSCASGIIVALKKMSRVELQNNNFHEQLKRQISIQSTLNHPYILKIYGYFWDHESVTLVLEYACNHQLFQVMKKVGKFTENVISRILEQLCQGLAYLHSQHIIHRDIKPQNILLSSNSVKIADFGWSVVNHSRRNTFCGTLDYLSPEMLKGEQHDSKVDIWALGILAFELLTGSTPFQDTYYSATLSNIVEEQINFPPSASEQCKMFIKKCLQKNPRYRPTANCLLMDPWIKKYSGKKIDFFNFN